MQAVHHSEAVRRLVPHSGRRRSTYVARWAVALGASFRGGVVQARIATALGRQIFVTAFPCGAIRHLSPDPQK